MTTPELNAYTYAELERINNDPIVVTVAGHANHGKTSLIRTLTRDRSFGEVRDEPGVTQDVSYTRFILHGKTYLKLYDTPGFQYSSLAIEHCGETAAIEDFEAFFESETRYDHDSRALAQARKSHIILYVVDVSQPPSERLRDDFHILARCLVPVLPLFNFIENPASNFESEWKTTLRRFNYHEFTRYDAHHYRPGHEQQLYKRMIDKLDDDPLHRKFLEWRMEDCQRRDADATSEARQAIAEMLVDCAIYREEATGVTADTRKDVEQIVLDTFRKRIQEREYHAFTRILATYNIEAQRLHNGGDAGDAVPLWERDVFNPESLKKFGVGVGGGAVSGAVTGGTIDAFVGGASFGAGAIIGAFVGGIAGYFGSGLFREQFDEETGTIAIQADHNMWRMLVGRSMALLHDVHHCGAASNTEFTVTEKPPNLPKKQLKELFAVLDVVARQPRFSEYGLGRILSRSMSTRLQTQRNEAIAAVVRWLEANEIEVDRKGRV